MRVASSALPCALIAACVGVRALEPGEPVDLAPGEALAFGRIRVFEGARELTPWNVDLLEELLAPGDPDVRLALFRVESEERALYPEVGPDGWYTWVLPAGTWLVYRTTQGVPVRHDVLCAFQVLPGSDPQYLGELDLEVEVERGNDLEACAYEVVAVDVRVDLQAARAFLARWRAGVLLEPVERRLATSPELRGLFDDWDRDRAARVLAALRFELRSD